MTRPGDARPDRTDGIILDRGVAPQLQLQPGAGYAMVTLTRWAIIIVGVTKLVNLGTNRWAFKTDLGISKALGAWTLELVPSVTFYTDNTDLLEGHTRTQEPIYAVQAHVIYGFKSGVWVAVDGTYFAGGRTSRDGVPDDDRQSNSRAGVTVALPVDRSNSVKFYASTGVPRAPAPASIHSAWRGNTGGAVVINLNLETL